MDLKICSIMCDLSCTLASLCNLSCTAASLCNLLCTSASLCNLLCTSASLFSSIHFGTVSSLLIPCSKLSLKSD